MRYSSRTGYGRIICCSIVGGVLLFGLTQSIGQASEAPSIDPALERAGWKELRLPNKNPTSYVAGPDSSIIAKSKTSVSILYRPIDERDQAASYLSWTWRVDQAVPKTDLQQTGEDDRDLSVHLWFPPEEGFSSGLGGLMKGLFGVPLSGRTITYIFGGEAERFDEFPNPYLADDGHMVVLRPSNSTKGAWFDETISISADFERAFGEPAPQPIYIAISADSDDTATQSLARIKNIRFERE